MRLPSLTTSPPMMAGSIVTARSTSLPLTALRALRSAARCSSLSCSATVTSAVASPLWLGHERAERLHHVAHREQPAVRGDKLEEFRRKPADPGALEHRGERLQLLVGGKHRAAHQPVEIGAFRDQRIEALEIRLDCVDRLLLAGEVEQRGRVAAGHAGYVGCFGGQIVCSRRAFSRSRNRRGQSAQASGIEPLDCGGPENGRQRSVPRPREIAALLTYRGMRCNMTESQRKRPPGVSISPGALGGAGGVLPDHVEENIPVLPAAWRRRRRAHLPSRRRSSACAAPCR